MALSFSELETQSAEVLPAREVMSSIGSVYAGPDCNEYNGGILNGNNVQDVLNTTNQIDLLNIANGSVDDIVQLID